VNQGRKVRTSDLQPKLTTTNLKNLNAVHFNKNRLTEKLCKIIMNISNSVFSEQLHYISSKC